MTNQHVIAMRHLLMSLRGAFSPVIAKRLLTCHCEERSDAAILACDGTAPLEIASLRSMKGTPPLSKLQRATLIVEPLQCGGEES